MATRADHYPRSRDDLVAAGLDADDPQYGRGLCASCDSRQTAQRQPGGWNRRQQLARVVIVFGPPCAGKSSHVEFEAGPQDVVVDMDALAHACGAPGDHDPGPVHRQAAAIARDALIERLTTRPSRAVTVWIVQTARPDRSRWPDADLVEIAPPEDVCVSRARAAGRPRDVLAAIRRWYADAVT